MSLEVIIEKGTVIDGTGAGPFRADVGIEGGRVRAVGDLAGQGSAMRLDGSGKTVCPGFVDIHSHSDYYLLLNSRAESKIRQGVTTEVGGNCGYAAAPIAGEVLRERSKQYRENYGLELDWQGLAEYCGRLEQQRPSVNYAPLLGHNTIRASVMGMEQRPPAQKELEEMKALVSRGMEEGAFGISSGLVYPPACYSQAAELAELCKISASYGGFLSCHIRSEGPRLLESLEEIIGVAEKARIPLQISHLKTAGSQNWYKLPQALELIAAAQSRGVEITADRYPYLASNAGLQALLPDWAFEGGREAQLKRLRNPETRSRMSAEILHNHPEEEYWDKVFISQVTKEKNRSYAGMTVAEAACIKERSPLDFVFDLLLEEEMQVEAIYFIMNERNLHKILALPYVMIGSDAACRAHYGPLGEGKPHPRAFGAFPRVLSHYVREEGVLKLEQAIHKMTAFPCKKLGITDRGIIKEGMWADIVVFDPRVISDQATYQQPFRYPCGIDYVLVNGVVTVEKGGHCGAGAGRVLKKK